MRKFLIILISLVGAASLARAQTSTPSIVPQPYSVQTSPGELQLGSNTIVRAEGLPANHPIRNLAQKILYDYFHRLPSNDLPQNQVTQFVLKLDTAMDLPSAEGYRFTVSGSGIFLTGKSEAGLFYGLQTFLQLFPLEEKGSFKLPYVRIEDYPRFPHRGMMLDVCRHFFPVSTVKKMIDLLAQYKMNVFHWHLSDDQGWRIEIKKYPKLTQVGGTRAQTLIGNYHDRFPQQFDGVPHGGFYTQQQIREVVRYAQSKYITIIPEIDMPGHMLAALAAYPQLSCDIKKPYKTAETWGVFSDVLCPTEYTFGFMQDVLSEVMDLFPSKYIHIGGDEVPKAAWKKSKFCQQLIKRLKLKDEHGLQSYFIQRMEKFVNAKGRIVIGWDEILEGGLAPNAVVMSWRGEAGGIAAARQNHEVIMTPQTEALYLNFSEARSDKEPLSIGGYAPLSRTYRYDPVSPRLTPDQQKYIRGVQANIWTEYIGTEEKLQYMLLPRLLDVSEVAWTFPGRKNFTDFQLRRLPVQLTRLEKQGLNFRVPEPVGAVDSTIFSASTHFDLKQPVSGGKIFYTVDGYAPRNTDIPYTAPFAVNVPAGQQRVVQFVATSPRGKQSVPVKMVINNSGVFAGKQDTTISRPGLRYKVFKGEFFSTAEMSDSLASDSGVARSWSLTPIRKRMKNFGISYDGYIYIRSDGTYRFSTASDDGSVLFLDGVKVLDNDGRHSYFETTSAVPLQKGYHRIRMLYFDARNVGRINVNWQKPDGVKTELPFDILFN
ncbi:MAG: family 20 glycosylhydrolase [Mucilaginibacter polytrichastri]|nr:family 20 glycosylhydrolase [Mucilaginibacter polytrichastri]